MKKEPYKSISCSYYDELLRLATRKQIVNIAYTNANKIQSINAVIVDVFTKEKEEFLTLNTGQMIRLDHLISVDSKPIQYSC